MVMPLLPYIVYCPKCGWQIPFGRGNFIERLLSKPRVCKNCGNRHLKTKKNKLPWNMD